MKYISLSDLSNTIRNNLYKIPRNIDYVIGVPRSGMIAASLISSYLNVPLIDVYSFCAGLKPSGGGRLLYFNKQNNKATNNVLVIDDTVNNGGSMNNVKQLLSQKSDINFIYMCVYLEGRGESSIDLYLEDVRQYTDNFTIPVLYEWNIFQHYPYVMSKCMYDMDGVLCIDPPDERNETEYIEYIKNAKPLFVPRTPIGAIITYRLQKNEEITKQWLAKYNILYNALKTFPANSWEERNDSGISPELFKGTIYKKYDFFNLFVESNDYQAQQIAKISGKNVYCVETNKMY